MRTRTAPIALAAFLAAAPLLAAPVQISIDPATRHQTIAAWETTIDLFWPDKFTPYRDEIFDRLIDDVGITRLRVGVFCGDENIDHSFEDYRTGRIDYPTWSLRRYVTINDDADPFHINWAGFDFSDLDYRIEQVFVPMRARAEARGRKLDFNLNYVAFTDQSQGGPYIHTEAEEYAEFILAAFLHMQEKYGFTPDAVEVLLEPENSPHWTPELLAKAIAAVTRRLAGAGFHPRLIAPSVEDARHAVPWMKAIAAEPGAMDLMGELSYHRYWGGSDDVVRGIAEEAAKLGLDTAMLEFWFGRATEDVLFKDLTVGNVSAWQGNTVFTHHRIDTGLRRDQRLILGENPRMFRQVTAYVHPGDQRIGAASSDPALAAPVAFAGPDGATVVVLRTLAAGQAEISGLPPGTYHVSYAITAGTGWLDDPVTVTAGVPLTVDLRGKGVLTVTSRDDRAGLAERR